MGREAEEATHVPRIQTSRMTVLAAGTRPPAHAVNEEIYSTGRQPTGRWRARSGTRSNYSMTDIYVFYARNADR